MHQARSMHAVLSFVQSHYAAEHAACCADVHPRCWKQGPVRKLSAAVHLPHEASLDCLHMCSWKALKPFATCVPSAHGGASCGSQEKLCTLQSVFGPEGAVTGSARPSVAVMSIKCWARRCCGARSIMSATGISTRNMPAIASCTVPMHVLTRILGCMQTCYSNLLESQMVPRCCMPPYCSTRQNQAGQGCTKAAGFRRAHASQWPLLLCQPSTMLL